MDIWRSLILGEGIQVEWRWITDMNESEMPVVMFTNYKRVDGFEVSITLRGTDLADVAKDLDTAIKAIIAKGGTPVSRQNKGFPPKVINYVEGRTCPKDGGRLIKPDAGSNKPIKCENNRWNFQTKQVEGCPFVEWTDVKSGYEQDMEAANAKDIEL